MPSPGLLAYLCAYFLITTIAPVQLAAQSVSGASQPGSSAAPVASSLANTVASPKAQATVSISSSVVVPSTPVPQTASGSSAAAKGNATPKGAAPPISSGAPKGGAGRKDETSSSTVTTPSTGTSSVSTGTASTPRPSGSTLPDVHLKVPNLSVKRIELDVDNLKADINLNANVAGLVAINAGVAVGIKKVNITIADVAAKAELTVRLGNLVEVVNRVFKSLDLNPLLITALDTVTGVVDNVIGAVDGLLGSIVNGDSKLSFLIDNLGNIVQELVGSGGGSPQTSIVGNWQQNMTYTGVSQNLDNGLVKKTYKYSPLNALVDIIFNAAGNIVQATVVNQKPPTSSPSNPPSSTGSTQPSQTPPPNSKATKASGGGGSPVRNHGL